MRGANKTKLANSLGVSRSSLYYVSRKEKKDLELKTKIEEVLRTHRAYGSRRIAMAIKLNRKRVQRVMRKFNIKPYRRRRTKKRRKQRISAIYANLLLTLTPEFPHHVWAADFTEVWFQKQWVYIATVIDLYTREVVGTAISLRKGAQLTLLALYNALLYHPHPEVFHSDNGVEYDAGVFKGVLKELDILVSRSYPGCPWENGYQESFYDKFKLELGDPHRCRSLGELVAEIYGTVRAYNNTRIHSALKMPPKSFAEKFARDKIKVHRVS